MSALQPGQQGSALLLKTENGQYRLLQLGPAASQPGQPALPNSGANQTIRIQTVPSVSRFTGPPLALRKTIVTQQPLKTKANVNLNSLFKTNFILLAMNMKNMKTELFLCEWTINFLRWLFSQKLTNIFSSLLLIIIIMAFWSSKSTYSLLFDWVKIIPFYCIYCLELLHIKREKERELSLNL